MHARSGSFCPVCPSALSLSLSIRLLGPRATLDRNDMQHMLEMPYMQYLLEMSLCLRHVSWSRSAYSDEPNAMIFAQVLALSHRAQVLT